MSEESGSPTVGGMRAAIANGIVRLQAEYYGRGPTKSKAYITEDLVVVVLEESFTRAERTLVERGEKDAIQQIRRRFSSRCATSSQAWWSRSPGARSGCS